MKILKLFFVVFVSTFHLNSWAQSSSAPSSLYPESFIEAYKSNQLKDQDLLLQLHKFEEKNHITIGYEKAKDYIFGYLYLEKLSNQQYAVTDVYCERQYTDQDFGQMTLGPMKSPQSGDVINTEHTWPQSEFTSSFPKEMQKSDLHHLFPTDSKMNGARSNYHFGDVTQTDKKLNCPTAELGTDGVSRGIIFEAPFKHKGNVARALFYFASRYNLKIDSQEEKYLRQWNLSDPVDVNEKNKNDEIQKIQGNRNPFIDFPDLVDHIATFGQ